MKLHELWTVTKEIELTGKLLIVEGRLSPEAPIVRYYVTKDPEKNKGQWTLVRIP